MREVVVLRCQQQLSFAEIAVVLDSPRGEAGDGSDLRFGGVSAAPVFSNIAEAALHRLGVPPDGS